MAPETKAQGGQQLVAEGAIDPATVAREKRRREDVDGDRFLHCRFHRPMTFSGIGNSAAVGFKHLILGKRIGRKVEQPRRNDAATPPNLRDIGKVEVKALILGQLVGYLERSDDGYGGECDMAGEPACRRGLVLSLSAP